MKIKAGYVVKLISDKYGKKPFFLNKIPNLDIEDRLFLVVKLKHYGSSEYVLQEIYEMDGVTVVSNNIYSKLDDQICNQINKQNISKIYGWPKVYDYSNYINLADLNSRDILWEVTYFE